MASRRSLRSIMNLPSSSTIVIEPTFIGSVVYCFAPRRRFEILTGSPPRDLSLLSQFVRWPPLGSTFRLELFRAAAFSPFMMPLAEPLLLLSSLSILPMFVKLLKLCPIPWFVIPAVSPLYPLFHPLCIVKSIPELALYR